MYLVAENLNWCSQMQIQGKTGRIQVIDYSSEKSKSILDDRVRVASYYDTNQLKF